MSINTVFRSLKSLGSRGDILEVAVRFALAEAVAPSDGNASNPTANADTAAAHAAHTDQRQVDGYVLRELHRHQLRSC